MIGPRARDLALSALGQVGSAMLTLLYLRLAVRGTQADVYGLSSVWIGAHLLLRSFLVLPLLHLLVYRYHQHHSKGQGPTFRTALLKGLIAAFAGLTLAALFGMAWFPPTATQWVLGGLLVGSLGLAEGMKGFTLSHLNLAERHGVFAATTLAEAALRLGLLWGLLPLAGHHPALLVAVPALASGLVALVLNGAWRKDLAPWSRAIPLVPLLQEHQTFLLPLLLLAITTWIMGLSDRYFLLQRVGGTATGLYAAVYGIFSTPFAILVGTLIQVFRPRLSVHASKRGGAIAYARVHRQFLTLGLISTFLLAILLWSARPLLLRLMLRSEHAPLFSFLPLLLVGQVAFAIGQLIEQGFYIRQQMGRLVIKQIIGAIAALFLMGLLIPSRGVQGAFLACAGYYTIECLCGVVLFVRAPVDPSHERAGNSSAP